jgi:cytochrome c oxidase cbb3-type subunit 3
MIPFPRLLTAAVAGVVCLGFAACDALPGRPAVANREVVPSQVTAFDVLYGRNCAGCHGADGRLGAARSLNDPVYLALMSADRLRTIIGEGVAGTPMPAFRNRSGGDLTDAQVDALAKEMLSRWGRADAVASTTVPPYEGPGTGPGAGDRERGRATGPGQARLAGRPAGAAAHTPADF